MFEDIPSVIIYCTGILAVLAITAIAVRFRRNSVSPIKLESSSKSSTSTTAPPHNPWRERQDRGVAVASNTNSANLTKRKNNSQQPVDKPFQSSYYYAHNNPSAKGGYKDGLRMEDYTMNQPRLLSRNGSQIVTEEAENATSSESVDASPPLPNNTQPPIRYLSISRYLWDDPGKANGIASILIEHLPDTTAKNGSILWKEWVETQSTTTPRIDIQLLEQKILRVILHDSTNANRCYELKMDPLYGAVSIVTAKVSARRLTIQLHKLNDKKTAWPHPHQSKMKST